MRLPLPWVCLMSVCGNLAIDKKPWVAVALVVGFVCYLRRGELESLTHQQLVAPTPQAGGHTRGGPSFSAHARGGGQRWARPGFTAMQCHRSWRVDLPVAAAPPLDASPADRSLVALPADAPVRVRRAGGCIKSPWDLRHGGAPAAVARWRRPSVEADGRPRQSWSDVPRKFGMHPHWRNEWGLTSSLGEHSRAKIPVFLRDR